MTAPMITKTMQLVGKGLLIFLGGTLSLFLTSSAIASHMAAAGPSN